MKRLALFTVVFGLAFSAVAQTPAADPADPAVPQAASTTATDAGAAKAQATKDDLSDRNGRKCAIATGHAYTKEDLDRTGEVDLAAALRKLDPTIR